ncbi:MAG: uroporphyrin-III C-methyltransferase/precorrin-2 dehydrogenase/sirohydrochlorin ferrochelatase [Saprospiraceae bacterium]|jgi:uroporphyrin-III C-methyltransferase/precorrin-2 dehydrogenase/sirohydrochlorin ferrochelatase
MSKGTTKLLPLSVNVKGKPCLMIGGGPVAFRRTKSLVNAGAKLEIISERVLPELEEFIRLHQIPCSLRSANLDDVEARFMIVVVATDNRALNSELTVLAKQYNSLVNVSDDAQACDIAFPSVLDRDPLQIAISSGSASPILSKMLMRRLRSVIPSGYGQLASLVGHYRKQVIQAFPDIEQRKAFWERALNGAVAESVFSGNSDKAESLLKSELQQPLEKKRGEVYLIGAGPGDPDLLTVRAVRLLNQVEVIVYDRLVSPEILAMFGEDQEMVYVGKQRSNHSVPQNNINQILVDYAKQGKTVARLKGGDPFIFGRGGEEIETLAQQQIPFQVIPGITAAAGCASYSGIPLTHRDYAQSVRFITGQLKDGSVNLNWSELTDTDQTLVFYMGLNGFPIISKKLIEHGVAPTHPVALIEKGTTPQQKVHIASLGSITDYLKSHSVSSPSLFIVGEVVNLHSQLAWFEPSSQTEFL